MKSQNLKEGIDGQNSRQKTGEGGLGCGPRAYPVEISGHTRFLSDSNLVAKQPSTASPDIESDLGRQTNDALQRQTKRECKR
jgi:hypothetical protein